jgi:hypothetical protein
MTVHARLGGRDIGETRGLDRRVAVPAVQPYFSHMMGVAERDRLLARNTGLRGPGRSAESAEQPTQESYEKHSSEDAYLRKRVGAAMEDLCHLGARYFLPKRATTRSPYPSLFRFSSEVNKHYELSRSNFPNTFDDSRCGKVSLFFGHFLDPLGPIRYH